MSVSCGVVPPLPIRGRVDGTNFKGSPFLLSLHSRRLEVVGTRKNGRARRRDPRTGYKCGKFESSRLKDNKDTEVKQSHLRKHPRARPFSLSPTASKRLLRRLFLTNSKSATSKRSLKGHLPKTDTPFFSLYEADN